jgi:hypothetical protein
VDSVTAVALIGVGGTVITALSGVVGSVRTAGIGSRSNVSLEDRKSRRATYSACAAALLVQRDAALRLMNDLDVHDLDVDRAKEKVAQAQALRNDIGTTVGAVVVEGPDSVADAAEAAAFELNRWLDDLAWWVELGRPHEKRRVVELGASGSVDRVGHLMAVCREALHPDEGSQRRQGKRLPMRWDMGRSDEVDE